MLTSLLALASLALPQDAEPVPPCPYDKIVELEITADDPELIEGRGPTAVYEYEVEFEGTLHVWTTCEIDLFIQVDDAIEASTLATDDNSGGVTTPYARLEVEEGDYLAVLVAAASDSSGSLTLHLIAAPETDATRAVATRVNKALAEVKELLDAGEHGGARKLLVSTLDELTRIPGVSHSPAIQRDLASIALLSSQLSDLHSTRSARSKILAFRERCLPDDHPNLQVVRGNLAITVKALGDLAGARALEEKVLEVRSRILPADHRDLQAARLNLAGTIRSLGNLGGARTLEEKVLEVFSRTLPSDHPDLQMARQSLAVTLSNQGDLTGARVLAEEVLEVRARTLPADHPDLQSAQENLAVMMAEMGDLSGALTLFENVLKVRARTLPADHPNLQAARLNLASTIRELGDLVRARALQEEALEVFSRTLPGDDPSVQVARFNLAATVKAQGDLAGARLLQKEVLEVFTRTLPVHHPNLQAARGNLAATIKAQGDYAGARVLEEKVLEVYSRILPADHPDLQRARLNLASTIAELGDLAGVLALEEKVVEVRSRTMPPNHPELQTARGNLATTKRELGDLTGARTLQEEVLEVFTETLPDDHPSIQWARANLALTMEIQGDLVGARALEEKALEVYSRILPADHHDLHDALGNLAITIRSMGDSAGARALLSELISGMLLRARTGAEFSPREAREAVAANAQLLSLALFLSDPSSAESSRDLLELVETRRAVATEAPRKVAQVVEDDALRALMLEAERSRRTLNDLVAGRARDEGSGEEFRERLDEMSTRRDRAESAIRAALADRGFILPEISVESLSTALPENSALVGFLRFDGYAQDPETNRIRSEGDHLLVHVLRSDGTLTRLDLGLASDLETLVANWRAGLGSTVGRGVVVEESDSSEAAERRAGGLLRERLIDPVLEAAGVEATTLFVCPDDLAFLVPFDALPTPTNESVDDARLGDRVRIVVRTSLARLVDPLPDIGGEPSLLALGNPDYNGEGAFGEPTNAAAAPIDSGLRSGEIAGPLLPLPQTAPEIESIRALFQRSYGEVPLVMKGEGATKAALVEAAGGARYLHMATHGWFAPETVKSILDPDPAHGGERLWTPMTAEQRVTGFAPMTLCGLALAGANRGMDSLGRVPGIMTAEELATLDLSNCELAVLSACETNVGIRRAGQGIQSLQTALHAAGARTAITSLWKVDDAATRKLMELFYTYLWIEKMPVAEALWKAKTDLRKAGHPVRDWAGWVLSGEAGY